MCGVILVLPFAQVVPRPNFSLSPLYMTRQIFRSHFHLNTMTIWPHGGGGAKKFKNPIVYTRRHPVSIILSTV